MPGGCLVRVRGRTSFQKRKRKNKKKKKKTNKEIGRTKVENNIGDERKVNLDESSAVELSPEEEKRNCRRKHGRRDEENTVGASFAHLFVQTPSNHHIRAATHQERLRFDT